MYPEHGLPVRILLAVTAFVCLTALSMPTTLQRQAVDAPLTYTFVDARPPQQLKSGTESRMITACAYGSLRVGSKDFTPDLSVVVNDMLMARFAAPLAGKKVTLVNFTVHLNDALYRRGLTHRMTGGGAIEGLLNDQDVTGCAPDDLRGGYVASELQDRSLSPWVLVVDLEVDGRKIHVRHVQPADPRVNKVAEFGKYKETLAMQQAARDADLGVAVAAVIDRLALRLSELFAESAPATTPASPPFP